MVRFGIRDKILISFVALSLISMGIISSISLKYLSLSNERALNKMSEISITYASGNQELQSVIKSVEEESNRDKNEYQLILIAVIVCTVMIVCGVSFLLSETITRPMTTILRMSQCAIDRTPCEEKINTGDEFQILSEQLTEIIGKRRGE